MLSADKPAGLKVCLNACTSKGSLHKTRDWSCSGVNVVPVINPPTTAPMFHNFSICDNIPKELSPEELATCMAFQPNKGRGKCLKKAETRAQAAWLACRKSVVNIPWTTSLASSVVDIEKAKRNLSIQECVLNQCSNHGQNSMPSKERLRWYAMVSKHICHQDKQNKMSVKHGE